MKYFFTGDSYHTKEGTPRFLLDRLALNTRIYFMLRYFAIVLKARKVALNGRYDTEAWASSSYDVMKLVEGCGGRIHITGLDNLRKLQGPVVFVSNHMSTLETQAFPCIIAPLMEVVFVVKDSILRHPFFGPIIGSRNPIPVSRTNPKADFQAVMNGGQEALKNGTSVIIFPQSTRDLQFKPKEFNTMGVKLARSANVQVVPIAIKTDFWGNGKHLKDLGPIDRKKDVHFAFGEPMSIEGSGKEENERIIQFISAHISEWAD